MQKGVIIKALSGFYYVKTEDSTVECKARGAFRKKELSPLVGDKVEINISDNNRGVIETITPRLNFLIRPPVANIDRLFIVVSTADPAPNTLVIDKMILGAEDKGIEPIIIINKSDLYSGDEIFDIYSKAGFRVIRACAKSSEGIDEVKPLIKDRVCAFCGNTGVGKSSILNAIDERFQASTGDISKKLGRGRHTTRHCELYATCGGFVADTPGFSSMDTERCDLIRKENIQFCFREFEPYLNKCKFTGCSHIKEKGCAVIEAVENGEICRSRWESYCSIHADSAKIKDWEFDKH